MKILSMERSAIAVQRPVLAFLIALLFHIAGLVGILFWNSPFIRDMTPIHLVLMGLLVFISSEGISRSLFNFLCTAGLLGFAAKLTGVHTGIIFGSYAYGSVLGPKLLEVPVLITLNWALVLLGAGNIMTELNDRFKISANFAALNIVFTGAVLATLFDWVMEPVAIKLGYWWWADNIIPPLNYVTWFIVSAFGLAAYVFFKPKTNQFFTLLFITQLAFFTLLRIAL